MKFVFHKILTKKITAYWHVLRCCLAGTQRHIWVRITTLRKVAVGSTFVCPCVVSIIVIDDQQDATILAYLFIPNQLCMFRAMFSPIIGST